MPNSLAFWLGPSLKSFKFTGEKCMCASPTDHVKGDIARLCAVIQAGMLKLRLARGWTLVSEDSRSLNSITLLQPVTTQPACWCHSHRASEMSQRAWESFWRGQKKLPR